jgi:shikimate kinase
LNKIRELLAVREPYYREADVLIHTGLRSTREITQQVVLQFKLVHEKHTDREIQSL